MLTRFRSAVVGLGRECPDYLLPCRRMGCIEAYTRIDSPPAGRSAGPIFAQRTGQLFAFVSRPPTYQAAYQAAVPLPKGLSETYRSACSTGSPRPASPAARLSLAPFGKCVCSSSRPEVIVLVLSTKESRQVKSPGVSHRAITPTLWPGIRGLDDCLSSRANNTRPVSQDYQDPSI